MRTLLLALLASCSLAALGCNDDSSGGVIIVDNGRLIAAFAKCPDCSDSVSLRSYGAFVFQGTDPLLGDALLARCGFVTSPNSTPGSSTQVQGCSSGVEFAIVSGQFRAFRVRNGWGGRTDTGFGIGASLDDVLRAQPGFVQVDTSTYLLDDGTLRAEANFGQDGTLVELVVGRGFRR
jgi:hypothetical protein